MAEGRTNLGIARLLTITEGATEKHISNIFGKLDLPDTQNDHRRVLAVLTYLGSYGTARRLRHGGERKVRADECRSAGRAGHREGTVHARDSSGKALQAAAGLGMRATRAVIPDLDDESPVLTPTTYLAPRRATVLGDVGQRLRDDEVGRPLDGGREPLTRRRARS